MAKKSVNLVTVSRPNPKVRLAVAIVLMVGVILGIAMKSNAAIIASISLSVGYIMGAYSD